MITASRFISPLTVTEGLIAAGAVTESKIGAGAVTQSKIAASAVVESHIAANAVTASKIAANAVAGSHVAASAIVGSHIAASVIVASHLASGIAGSKCQLYTLTGTCDGTNQDFTIPGDFTPTIIQPIYEGVWMKRVMSTGVNTNNDTYYYPGSGTSVTIGVAPAEGANLAAFAIGS